MENSLFYFKLGTEVLGLLASLILLLPAFRKSRFSRLFKKLIDTSDGQNTENDQLQTFKARWIDATTELFRSWEAQDFLFIVIGLLFLLLSFVLKVVLVSQGG